MFLERRKTMSSEITLPEITIVGNPGAQPSTQSDWWAEGFIAGYNKPDETPERLRPLVLNDETTAIFLQGVNTGQRTAREVTAELEAELADQPQIGPDLGGESLQKAQERFKQAFEVVVHQHMPHTESESEVVDPPAPTIGLVVE
jgi:hypothetical protein